MEYARIGLKKENPVNSKVTFHQNGNYYAPGMGYISEFGVMDLFDEEALYSAGAMSESLNEVRGEAREDFSQTHNLDIDVVEENFLDENWEHYEAVQKAMDEWESAAVSYFQEQAGSAQLDEVIDERVTFGPDGKEIITNYSYIIEWED